MARGEHATQRSLPGSHTREWRTVGAAAVTATAALGLLAAGCGQPARLNVVVSGSSTVEPISIAVAEDFHSGDPDLNVYVDGPGTGDGFALFCEGEIDINDASSKIAAEQIEACEANDIEFIELRIGNDGIVMLTNEANEDVTCLEMSQLYALLGPESQGVDTWDGANALARELGAGADLPGGPLEVTGPGEESGTYVSFVELAIEDLAESRGEPAQTRADYQASSDDNVIITGIQRSTGSLGWVGFAFARSASGVNLLALDDGAGCVEPTAEAITSGEYPLSRPLYLYVNAERAAERPELAEFVEFYLHDAIGAVSEVGYVSLDDAALTETRERWSARTTGAAP